MKPFSTKMTENNQGFFQNFENLVPKKIKKINNLKTTDKFCNFCKFGKRQKLMAHPAGSREMTGNKQGVF